MPLEFQVADADDTTDTSRAATRRAPTTTTTTNRQKTSADTRTPNTATASRTVKTAKSGVVARDRTTTNQPESARTGNVVNDKNRGSVAQQPQKSVVARTASNVQSRTKPTQSRVATRDASRAQIVRSRTGTTTAPRATLTGRTASPSRAHNTMISRAGTTTDAATAIAGRDFKSCKTVFYDCMDEFCANKDSALKRCACSSRASEFDGMKQQLALVEDKLLDFSQRLLTVNMDKEDALAINTATEGELAYTKDDDSESKKLLDDIAKKLNASFDNDNFNQNLNAISLSLNTDAAFDNIDSMMGASTTTKSGTALYNDALPICRDMALEICSAEDFAIVESGYQMSIEQDCNTVSKSYASQTEQARSKILESSALLDISRLNRHQDKNSDDILTCKKKMLDALTETTVCGTDLSKCLDTTGQYIDPATGEAFLTVNLADLGKLITRPDADHEWKNIPENQKFVTFLNSKKTYLEPAMKNCQDISTHVWDEFIEDALSQIKLAQESKLEQVRQSCTTLTTQCIENSAKSISEFDVRALSVFGVKADTTVNAMCENVRTACTALMNATDITPDISITPNDTWESGMTEIAASKTYETILKTCREVGKNCIVQACSSVSGNFGLCENIDTSINRKSIINRRACWDEVKKCVADAGANTLAQIMKNQNRISGKTSGDIYEQLYGNKRNRSNPQVSGQSELQTAADDPEEESATPIPEIENPIYDICAKEIDDNTSLFEMDTCRIAEQIWGNCEYAPTHVIKDSGKNQILINNGTDSETLLSWFARNTGTNLKDDSCRDTTCPKDTRFHNTTCVSIIDFTDDGQYCPNDSRLTIAGEHQNCCPADKTTGQHCCYNAKKEAIKASYYATNDPDASLDELCAPGENAQIQYVLSYDKKHLVCIGTLSYRSDGIICSGNYVVLTDSHYVPVSNNLTISEYYYPEMDPFSDSNRCEYQIKTEQWDDTASCKIGS
ncbi:MAG: hypothetical protein J6R99_05010, partial [Alphaproteobacteria bacterium]|nr:hypothetical protein [Alphaproteobacteria bacterium]